MATYGTAELLSTRGGVDEDGKPTATSIFQVLCDYQDSQFTALTCPGLPAWGNFYQWYNDFAPWIFAFNFSAEPGERIKRITSTGSGDQRYWKITVQYKTPKKGSQQQQNTTGNPLLEPPRVSGSFSPYNLPAYRDKDDNPIVNAAKELYDPPPETESAYDTLSIEFNTATINLRLRAQYRNAVNSIGIWGLDVRQAKITRWGWQVSWAGAFPYIINSMEFLINLTEHPEACNDGGANSNKIGWYTTLPNSGLIWVNGDGEKINTTDRIDNPTQKPVYLDCDGLETEDEHWNVFAVEPEKDFRLIPGLPLVLPGPFV